MEVNFIITCFDKEKFALKNVEIIKSYKRIKPNIFLAYNGNDDTFPCDAKIENLGLQLGEYSLIKEAYTALKNKDKTNLWVKVSADSWLCDENYLYVLLTLLQNSDLGYFGSFWNHEQQLSSDIFLANTEKYNLFEEFFDVVEENKDGLISGTTVLESLLFYAAKRKEIPFRINPYRNPVHPNNRNVCYKAGWTMEHDFDKNLENLKMFQSRERPEEHYLDCFYSWYAENENMFNYIEQVSENVPSVYIDANDVTNLSFFKRLSDKKNIKFFISSKSKEIMNLVLSSARDKFVWLRGSELPDEVKNIYASLRNGDSKYNQSLIKFFENSKAKKIILFGCNSLVNSLSIDNQKFFIERVLRGIDTVIKVSKR